MPTNSQEATNADEISFLTNDLTATKECLSSEKLKLASAVRRMYCVCVCVCVCVCWLRR